MGSTIEIKGYTGKTNPEFTKHLKAVEFCFENDLSLPIETSEFFRGKVDGGNIEDCTKEVALDYVRKGLQIPLRVERFGVDYIIKVKEIPTSVDEIVVTFR